MGWNYSKVKEWTSIAFCVVDSSWSTLCLLAKACWFVFRETSFASPTPEKKKKEKVLERSIPSSFYPRSIFAGEVISYAKKTKYLISTSGMWSKEASSWSTTTSLHAPGRASAQRTEHLLGEETPILPGAASHEPGRTFKSHHQWLVFSIYFASSASL